VNPGVIIAWTQVIPNDDEPRIKGGGGDGRDRRESLQGIASWTSACSESNDYPVNKNPPLRESISPSQGMRSLIFSESSGSIDLEGAFAIALGSVRKCRQ